MYSCSMDACIAVDMELSPCDSVDASRYASHLRTELKTKNELDSECGGGGGLCSFAEAHLRFTWED